jgi:hypothetical protein
MAPSRQSSTKKRSRQDREDREQEEPDDIKSPTTKKRNTLKSPTPSESVSRGRAAAASTPSRRGRAGKRPPPPPVAEDEGVQHNESDDDEEDEEIAPPPPLPLVVEDAAEKSRSIMGDSFAEPGGDKEPLPQNDADGVAPEDLEEHEDFEDNSFDNPASKSRKIYLHIPSFQRPNRRELWLLLLVGCVLAFIAYLVLWTAFAMYDNFESTLEVHHCRRQIMLAYGNIDTLSGFGSSSSSKPQEEYFRQELEKQVQYWKRQAKQNEAFAQGYKDEYQAALQRLEAAV